jgi:hypothetical protein
MRISEVPFDAVRLEAGLLAERTGIHRSALLPAAIRKCESTGRVGNFRNAGLKNRGLPHGKHVGIYFDDSDVYKVLEGIGYALVQGPDPSLAATAAEWMGLIAGAQEGDGYLDTYFTLEDPGARWTDMERHEDYCAGHYLEAALAYGRASGDGRAMQVARRLADHLRKALPESGRHWVVGHQGLELALVKLYRASRHRPWLDLAAWFVEERGHGHGSGSIWEKAGWGPPYCQDDRPVRDLDRVTGHAVRAMYYYSGVADLAAETGDRTLEPALFRLWENVVGKNLYVTGGIGSSRSNEGFVGDYALPAAEAYCETCAAIGLAYWAHRMFLLTGSSRYVDVFERALYNNVLAGLSLDGTRFFYVNPLESAGAHHRQEWFDCSCCPTSLARFLPTLGGYLYAVDGAGITVNHYAASNARIPLGDATVSVGQRTDYPWSGTVDFLLEGGTREAFEFRLRVPSWAEAATLLVDGERLVPELRDGYLVVRREFAGTHRIRLDLPMAAREVHADPRVAEYRGMAAVQRGPVVYCAEEVDNPRAFPAPGLPADPVFLEGISVLQGHGVTGLQAVSRREPGERLALVPYYAWDNRSPGRMSVWLRRPPRPTDELYGP